MEMANLRLSLKDVHSSARVVLDNHSRKTQQQAQQNAGGDLGNTSMKQKPISSLSSSTSTANSSSVPNSPKENGMLKMLFLFFLIFLYLNF